MTTHTIFLCEKGDGFILIDEQAVDVFNRQVILIRCGEVCSFEGVELFQGYKLVFDNDFWEKSPKSASNCKSVLFDQSAINHSLPIDGVVLKELMFLFGTLLLEYQKEKYINKEDALAAFLKIIMIKIANINHSDAERYNALDKQKYVQFLDLIDKKGMEIHDVERYAAMLLLSPRQLSIISKRYSGYTAKVLINNHRITEAKRLLQFSSMPIKEIAYQLNFSTADHFSHFFKKYMKQSPQHYREVL
ncbi:helix-turn-helix domain-containing protein [Olivibacter sp. CPCC 100613]|uniref:helix-turn-helix domain-containing protein n=1 Tax=Olivibacter sp. CPCC 100613 TaxID=3079931 RepID=UPI002FFA3C7B